MRDQLTLLYETEWDVLIVLDACRPDMFREAAGACEVVRSPAVCTADWLPKVAPLLLEHDVRYFSANPVVERTASARALPLDLISIWRCGWGRWTEQRVPSVHPALVNGFVLALLHEPHGPGGKLVVHYLQPHSPYIGVPPLAAARWAAGPEGLHAECHRLPRPDKLVESGELTWTELRLAALGNTRLVWDAARNLMGAVALLRADFVGGPTTFVVTADHSELIGEGGRFGHERAYGRHPLCEVPWRVETLDPRGESEDERTSRKLEALGYA